MSDQKTYSAKEAAIAVLKKAEELLKISDLAKAEKEKAKSKKMAKKDDGFDKELAAKFEAHVAHLEKHPKAAEPAAHAEKEPHIRGVKKLHSFMEHAASKKIAAPEKKQA